MHASCTLPAAVLQHHAWGQLLGPLVLAEFAAQRVSLGQRRDGPAAADVKQGMSEGQITCMKTAQQ
jgi:hypothetical protein